MEQNQNITKLTRGRAHQSTAQPRCTVQMPTGETRSEEPGGLERAAGRGGLRDALVTDDGDVREVGLDAERGVERVRLRARLRRRGVRGARRGLARRLRGRVRAARARELAADEVRDHADRVGGAYVT